MSNSGLVLEYSDYLILHIRNWHPKSALTICDLCLIDFIKHARILTKKGPYTNQSLLRCEHVGIQANSNQARHWDSCNHDFGFSISSLDSTFVPAVWKSP